MRNLKKHVVIILMFFCTLSTAFAQFFFKKGMMLFSFSSFFNYFLLFGIILSIISLILFLLALKKGDLNFVYPLISLSYVWVMVISFFLLEENISFFKLLGIMIIVLGIFFINRGGIK